MATWRKPHSKWVRTLIERHGRISPIAFRNIVYERKRRLGRERNARAAQRRVPLTRQREIRFVAALIELMSKKALENGQVTKADIVALAGEGAVAAGYGEPRAEYNGKRLLGLPRIQDAMQQELEAVGLGIADRAKILAKIAKGNLGRGKDKALVASAQIKALELVTKITTGFAVQKQQSANLNLTGRMDKLFNESIFANPPAAKAVAGQDAVVTEVRNNHANPRRAPRAANPARKRDDVPVAKGKRKRP